MKTEQLQIRVTVEQKRQIRHAAEREGSSLTAYVLSRVLPDESETFVELVGRIDDEEARSYALADLADWLESLSPAELRRAVAARPPLPGDVVWANYVAAMVETAAYRKHVTPPAWVSAVPPLDDPWFATTLKSLRLYLLCESPPAFRRRNLFVDATLGDRV